MYAGAVRRPIEALRKKYVEFTRRLFRSRREQHAPYRQAEREFVTVANRPAAATYDRLVPMLEAAHREMTELFKKTQDGVVNALKIKMLNRLLGEPSKVIEKEPSYAFIDTLDEETLPQNSDPVLILSPWQAALKRYKGRHHGFDGVWAALVHGGEPRAQTSLMASPLLCQATEHAVAEPGRARAAIRDDHDSPPPSFQRLINRVSGPTFTPE